MLHLHCATAFGGRRAELAWDNAPSQRQGRYGWPECRVQQAGWIVHRSESGSGALAAVTANERARGPGPAAAGLPKKFRQTRKDLR
jgi:hypothetical protein